MLLEDSFPKTIASIFLKFFFIYIIFVGGLFLARYYLNEIEIWPFFYSWYAKESEKNTKTFLNERHHLNQKKNSKDVHKILSIRKYLEKKPRFNFDIPESSFIENSLVEASIYKDKNLPKIDEEFIKSAKYDTSGISGGLDGIELRVFGNSGVIMSYGFSNYLTKEDSRNDIVSANAINIREDFFLEAGLNLNLKGKIGKRVLIDVNYDQNERLLNNKIQLKYFALHKKEFVREVTVGNVGFNFPNDDSTEFKGFEKKDKETLGIEAKFKKGKLSFHSVATLIGGETATEIFTGNTHNIETIIPEYTYKARKYFQLEPFIYYDKKNISPIITKASYIRNNSDSLITFTSVPLNKSNKNYPTAVNIDSGSFEVWLDDQDGTNNRILNARTKKILGNNLGHYHLLQESDDYQINYKSGKLEFIKFIRSDSRIYVRYTRNRSDKDTADPSARTGVNGKIETFIYFGSSMNEDTNFDGTQNITIINDGKVNYDIYEVRSVYSLGAYNLQKSQLQLTIVDRNRSIIPGLNEQLGGYTVDFQRGLLSFYLREPFKALKNQNQEFILNDMEVKDIYSEIKIDSSEISRLMIEASLVEEIQNYKLQHPQIIQNSVQVTIDGIKIKPTLYIVDYLLGFLSFSDKRNPIISSGTRIEVTYQYSPFGQKTNGFILGLRSEYEMNRNIKLGNTLLYNAQLKNSQVPKIGEEPVSRFIIENDLKVNLGEKELTKFINYIPGIDLDLLPVRYNFYGEYTKSFYNPNTVNIALVDDMESSEDKIELSLSDRDWQLSSLPPSLGLTECDRAPLLYRYYRDLNNLELGPTRLNTPIQASPNYRQLAGPYNVAEGHLDFNQLKQAERQVSLVMDFDFSSGGKVASIVTRRFSPESNGQNLAQIEYIEFSAKLIDPIALSEGVSIRFDIGTINEDSDADSKLDTEDVGSDGINNDLNGDGLPDIGTSFSGGEQNGRIDQVVGGFTEDRGYHFNAPRICSGLNTRVGSGPAVSGNHRTDGNGVLNTEDLNGDGRLETTENVITFDELNRNYINFDIASGLHSSNIILSENWHLVRMYLNREALNDTQKQLLHRVKSIRLYVVPSGVGSANGKGRILIDNIKLGRSLWRRKKLQVNNVESDLEDTKILNISTIDNQDSRSEYANASFIAQERNEYEKLHGIQTNFERSRMREAALKINYNFNSSLCTTGVCKHAYVRRVFLRSLDLSSYNKINIWVNYRKLNTSDDYFFFRFGSSDNNYVEGTEKMNTLGWHLLSFDIPKQSEGEICPKIKQFHGCPNLKRVNTMILGVRNESSTGGSEGIIWVNDIFVSESNTQNDDFYMIKNDIKVIKPFYKTKGGVSIFDNFKVSYDKRYQGNNFFTLNQNFKNISMDANNLSFTSTLLPFLESAYTFSYVTSESFDNKLQEQKDFDGKLTRVTHSTQYDFKFENKYYPRVTVKYEYQNKSRDKQNLLNNVVDTEILNQSVEEYTYVPYISFYQKFLDFGGHKLTLEAKTGIQYFKKEENLILSDSFVIPKSTQNKKSKEQKDEMDSHLIYQWGDFRLQTSYFFRQVLLVNQNFTDNQISSLINGNFYFPFYITASDFRYVQRLSKYKLDLEYRNFWIFSPKLEYLFNYLENSFRDNSSSIIFSGLSFQRYKQPNSYARTNFSLNFDLKKISKKLSFFKKISTSFFREVSVNENFVPFSAKTGLFEDKYGLSSRFQTLFVRVYDLFSYPFWQHFTSKNRSHNNFSEGRAYIQMLNFSPISPSIEFEDVFSQYSQIIFLKEHMNMVINWSIFDGFLILNEAHLSQTISRRGNIGALPHQIVNLGVSVRPTIDLMKILNFWFWSKPLINKKNNGEYYQEKSSNLDINFRYENHLKVTSNISRKHYIPEFNLSFNWLNERSALQSLRFQTNLDFSNENESDFFITNGNQNDISIFENIQKSGNRFKKENISFGLSILYVFGIPLLREWLQELTGIKLKKNPKYRIEFIFNLNRFNYDIYTNLKEFPSDFYILAQNLSMNIHTNIIGKMHFKSALEIQRDQETNQERQKILAFEIGLSIQIIF